MACGESFVFTTWKHARTNRCTRTAASRLEFGRIGSSGTGFAASARFRRRSVSSGVRHRDMRRWFITCMLWLAAVSSVRSTSLELLVTPRNLEHAHFTFSVVTNATRSSVVFQVTITSKNSDINPDSTASVVKVIRKSRAHDCRQRTTEPIMPIIPVTLKKEKQV